MSVAGSALRDRRLRALGIAPLRVRDRAGLDAGAALQVLPAPVPALPADVPIAGAAGVRITRLALRPDPSELADPAINRMYTALTEAIGKAGLEPVRACDVADDPGAVLLVFGRAPVPAGIPASRMLRTYALRDLHADRERKRLLWERMQALGRGEGG